MTIQEFENELKLIDPRLSIVQNPNRPEIANIKLDGIDICPIPSNEIKDEPDASYVITFPNGMVRPHKSKREALAMVMSTLENIKSQEGADIFYDR